MIGGDPRALAVAVGGSLDVVVHAGDVTEEGRVELLPFVREQAVAVVTHRAGHVDPAFRDLRL
jgi:RHH-type proline utilization regulon transcriptional repressor/proline dehydrogenase/delta 1-pyrroline-5-carboxylate dehydrogenase